MIRQTLIGSGFFEAVTFTFVSDHLAGDFVPRGVQSLPRADASVRKADARLRPSLLPGLLEAVRRNETVGTLGAKLFETGSTFAVDAAGKVQETRRLAVVGNEDYASLRGSIEALLNRLNADRAVRVVSADASGYGKGACGRIEWGGEAVGFIGLVDKKVAGKLSLREVPAVAELEAEKLIAGTQHVPQLHALARFPAIRRDLSLVVADQVSYESIETVLWKQKPQDLEAVEYVTTYRGKPLEKNQKSVTVTLVFRSDHVTLTSEQVEGEVLKIIEATKREVGAEVRG
jgi:phenylalanyl-tRNA synthetase beta chain